MIDLLSYNWRAWGEIRRKCPAIFYFIWAGIPAGSLLVMLTAWLVGRLTS